MSEIELLEKQLRELKENHLSMWNTYGSELCSGDMIRQENEIQEKIDTLKKAWQTQTIHVPTSK